jgi:hypothetical protein
MKSPARKISRLLTLALFFALPHLCAALVGDCTFYVSATGTGSGTSSGSPAGISSVASNSHAGAVICFMGVGGDYSFASSYGMSVSGSSTSPVTWIAYGDSAVNFKWTGGTNGGGSGTNTGRGRWILEVSAAYTVFDGINFVGNQYGNDAIYCASPGHHITVKNSTVTGFIYSGIACSAFDYETFINNQIWQNGENPNGVVTLASNAGSGLTPNQQAPYDSYTGLHTVICGNVITGTFDPTSGHTDGNGISLDLTTGVQAGGTLVCNNVIVMNGGDGIEVNSSEDNPSFPDPWTHVAVVNNTVAFSGMDLTRNFAPVNYANVHSTDVCYVNNISEAWAYSGTLPSGWSTTPPNWTETYTTTGTIFAVNGSSNPTNLWYQSVEGISNTLLNSNPLFVSPPTVSSSAGGQYASAPTPSALGNGMSIQSGSPAIGIGADPASVCTNLPAQTITDMAAYIYVDVTGGSRPHTGQDLGAYQVTASASGFAPGPFVIVQQ